MALTTSPSCPICQSREVVELLHMPGIPIVCNSLHIDKESALSTGRGDFGLTFCENCGHCFNPNFDESVMVYGANYETSLHFSPRFQTFATKLSKRLIETYDLRNKTIVEMGCGQGEFLSEICQLGNNRGIGFDQSFESSQATLPDFVTVHDQNYDQRFSDVQADLLCCRHVLEHVAEPHAFLNMVRDTFQSNKNGIVYFEVPNGLFTLRDLGIWDLIYEHCAYFCEESLRRLFEDCGFTVLRIETAYDDQFLTIDARMQHSIPSARNGNPANNSAAQHLSKYARNFATSFQNKRRHWYDVRRSLSAEGKSSVIWGAGSKGVTFLNLTQPADSETDRLLYAVDISPRKHGKFVPGTGQKIISPDALIDVNPDVVFLMNGTYADEVRNYLFSLGLSPQLEIV